MRPLSLPHFATLMPYVPGKPIEETEREYGVTNIAKLASNENALGASPRATAAAAEAMHKGHLYPDAGGYALKQRLAKLHEVNPATVVLGNGTNELISLLCRGLLGPGDALLNAWPSFVCYRMGAAACGVPERAVPLTADLRYDLDGMAKVARDDRSVKLVFLANPNNPTGQCFGAAELNRFLADVPPDVVVILDEAYAEYVRRADYQDGPAIVAARPRTMLLRTFSKVYGLAAWRIGYGIGDPSLIKLLDSLRDPFNTGAFAQVAALHALDDDAFVQHSQQHNAAELPRVAGALTAAGFVVTPSEGNFVLATLPANDKLDIATLNDKLLRRGLIVRPVGNYGLPRSVRITIGTVAENDRLLAAVHAIRGGA
jgi:histidinol-phosphate aminotransferase